MDAPDGDCDAALSAAPGPLPDPDRRSDTEYYETFDRPNVTLVDLRRTPIEQHANWIAACLR